MPDTTLNPKVEEVTIALTRSEIPLPDLGVKVEEKKVVITRIGITKKSKSKAKRVEKISKNSRRKNRK